jgi:zinc protease
MKSLIKIISLLSILLISSIAQAALNIQTWTTQNGSKVMYLYAPELAMVDIELKFDAGSARDGKQWGLASLTTGLLGTATKNMTENQISENFNEIGAKFSSAVSKDAATISLRSLTRDKILKQSLATFNKVVAKPVFNKKILKREKARLVLALKQAQTKPRSIASKAMWQGLYGKHPYAHATSGSIKTVKKITTKDLSRFYKKMFVAKNAQVSIVGNVNLAQAKKIAKQITSRLKKGKKPPAISLPNPLVKAKTNKIKFGSSQTHYSLSQIGIERGNEDYTALFVGNHILGGSGFNSLLMEEVRSKRGLVYGVYSYFAVMKVPGPFMISLSTKNSSAKEADQVVKEILNGFLRDFSDEKLQAIKDNLIGGFPLRMNSNSKILGYISMIGFYDLPLDYLERLPKAIAKVTKADILKAWQKHIQPERMLTVMVGDPK